ncbi:MAG: HlyC/CorC family transporter [Chloroflexi bacterium]|nr:HlyC/CorC family transporter [Chloroflexota bacterium]
METADFWKLALLLVCLVLSGFFSASETAFVALSRVRLTHLVSIGQPGANRVAQLIQRPEKFLATVLLCNNLVNTAVAALGTVLVVNLIGNNFVALIVATFGVTLVLLVFGETVPKTIAWHRSEAVAFAVSRPLSLVGLTLFPAVRVLQGVSWVANRALGVTGAPPQIGEEEIRTLIAVGAHSGTMEPAEAELLEKVFRFGDRQMREIMTPRPEIVWLEQGTTLEAFLSLYAEHSHSRFPVFEGSTENITGVLVSKDVLLAMGRSKIQPQDSVTELVRPAYFVPETKPVGSTFSEIQQAGHGMVLTVDEFGGIAGLATLRQLLEIIVGQVGGEGESPEEPYTPVDEHTFSLDGSMGIAEINEELHMRLPDGDYQTVAGFILDKLGRIPEEGDVVEYEDLVLTVKAMSAVKIEKVELRRIRTEQEETTQ